MRKIVYNRFREWDSLFRIILSRGCIKTASRLQPDGIIFLNGYYISFSGMSQ